MKIYFDFGGLGVTAIMLFSH